MLSPGNVVNNGLVTPEVAGNALLGNGIISAVRSQCLSVGLRTSTSRPDGQGAGFNFFIWALVLLLGSNPRTESRRDDAFARLTDCGGVAAGATLEIFAQMKTPPSEAGFSRLYARSIIVGEG